MDLCFRLSEDAQTRGWNPMKDKKQSLSDAELFRRYA